MQTLNIHKYQTAFPSERQAESVTIVIEEVTPSHKTLEDAQDFYNNEAKIIAEALHSTLPQGTIHSLMIEMLKRHPNLFHVSAK